MKATKLFLISLKFIRINSFSLFFLFIINFFIGCSVSKPAYPKDWAPIEENMSLESYSGKYDVLLLNILGSDSYKKDYVNNCKVNFWVDNELELKFYLNCKNDLNYKNNPSFGLVSTNKKIEIKKDKKGILINYKDFKTDAWGFESIRENVLLSKAKDGSLIIKKRTLKYGAILWFIPVEWQEENVWYRFTEDNVEVRNGK